MIKNLVKLQDTKSTGNIHGFSVHLYKYAKKEMKIIPFKLATMIK
jgi:hypothetical protein